MRTPKLSTLLIFTALSILSITVQADAISRPINIDRVDFSARLAADVMYLEDASGKLRLNQIQNRFEAGQFKAMERDTLHFGYSNSAFWLSFAFTNNLPHHNNQLKDKFFITARFGLLDDIQLYATQKNTLIFAAAQGDLHPYNDRLIDINDFAFPILLASGESTRIFMRVTSQSALSIPIYLETEKAFIENRNNIDSFTGLYFGITLGLLCYNLFLWVGIRRSIYGIYVLFIAVISTFIATLLGISYKFWPESVFFQQVAVYFFSLLSGVVIVWFGMTFLKIRVHLPRLYTALCGYQAITICAIFVIFFLSMENAAKVNAVIVFVGVLTLLAAAIKRYMQGYRPAAYYLIGQGSVLASVLFTMLASRGIIPHFYLAPAVLKWCTAFELFFFSVALADLTNEERRLRENAQRESAKAQKELLDVQIKLNEELDKKVQARTAALEQANAKLYELNTRDELTQVYNRRYFNTALQSEYKRAYRDKNAISILVIDIDHFKTFNDEHGHPFGDYCLAQAAERINNQIRRPPDFTARYGGEEFVVVLPNTPLEGAVAVAEKIRKSFSDEPVERDGVSIKLTVSIGVASAMPNDRDSSEALFKTADNLLYQAKQNGRNRVEWQPAEDDTANQQVS